MTNTKNTKRALLSSVLALFLCFAMLLGTTYAWFTDSVTSANNIIKSGTLDVEMYYADGTKAVPADDSAEWKNAQGVALYTADQLWEPGYTDAKHIKISNEGSLALKYQLAIIPTGEVSELAEVIDVYYIENATQIAEREDLANCNPIGTLADLINNGIKQGTLAADTDYTATLVLKMQETAGNEYQDKSIGDDFTIQLLATQLAAESDSFDNQYDADATFGTYIELEAGADLLAAMASAEADMPLTIKLNGDVEWPTEGHRGENDITPASSIVIDGNGYTITATGSGVTPLGDQTAPMTLKNVKIVDNSVSYNEGAWELTYLEMGGTRLTCENVTFADEIQTGTTATFTNCSFESNEESVYAVWVEDGSATFTGCTFTGCRGLKMHEDYGTEISSVVVKNCTFTDITKKPGIAIGDLNANTKVSVTDSTFINCQKGDQSLYIYETDTDATTFDFTEKNNIVESYTELVEIATKEQLVAFANRVNGGDGMSRVLVKLTDNIDLAGMEWTPIGQAGTSYGATNYFQGIFDGQGYTISNMTITQTNDGKNYAAGFFGFIDGAEITVRNVNFDKANIKGHHWTGVVAGYLTGNIDNCHVTNSTVLCTHANDDACGDKAGAVVGYINSGLVNNCSASDTTVTAGRDAGQIVGASKTVYVANCTATNVTVSANGDCTGVNINNDIIGRNLD